ncbi:MAG: GC-type dockerin domain-anchored protein [Phycisphaerales bacterium]
MSIRTPLAIAALAALAPASLAQVVINEVLENPPGSDDELFEYIELYGKPNTPLDGYIVCLLKGGSTDVVEIDESFQLDGLTLGSNGLLVIYNNTGGGTLLPPFASGTNSVSFTAAHVPSTDTPGKLGNDDSSTYVLLRGRPSPGSGGFATDWRKDIAHDVDMDSHVDFPHVIGAAKLEPYQMVDDIAFSNNMGMEYTREDQDELDETPGFNPDALTRMRYYGNPGPGPGIRAEEEWIRGEMLDTSTFNYDTAAMGLPAGVSSAGSRLTPGDYNDYALESQFRFLDGDINFDGAVNNADYTLAVSLLGATRDDRIDCVDDLGAPVIDPNTSMPYQCYKFQGRAFNALEALRCLDATDGPAGANDDAVTQHDIDALAALLTDCAVDYAPPFGTLDFSDVISFLTFFGTMNPAADLAAPFGTYDFSDVIAFLTLFGNCFP